MYLGQHQQITTYRQSSQRQQSIQLQIDQIKQINNQQYQIQTTIFINNYILYSISSILITLIISSLGPLIPYLSQYQLKPQISYISLFSFRAFGSILGSISLKYLHTYFYLHNIIIFGTLITSFSSFAFDIFYHVQIKCICILCISIGCLYINYGIKISSLQFYKDDCTKWIYIIQGLSGIGYICGPIFVYFLQLYTISIIAVLLLFSIFMYIRIKSPQEYFKLQMYYKQQQQQQQQKQQNKQQYKQQHKQQLSYLSMYLLAFVLFFAVGLKCVYGSWISSYIVIHKYTTKQYATFYNSIFYASSVIFSVIINIVKMKFSSTFKIQFLCIFGIITSILSYYLIYITQIQQIISLFIISMLYGISNSSILLFIYYIPIQYQYNLTQNIMKIFMIYSSLGQGIFTYIVGYIMDLYGYQWFIYCMAIGYVMILGIVTVNWWLLEKQKVRNIEKQNQNERYMEKYRKQSLDVIQNKYIIKSGENEQVYYQYEMVQIQNINKNTNKIINNDLIHQKLLGI